MKDKTGEMLTGTPGMEAPQELENASAAGDTGEERDGRRIGVVLIVVGCGLVALAAGEPSAAIEVAGPLDTLGRIFAGLVP